MSTRNPYGTLCAYCGHLTSNHGNVRGSVDRYRCAHCTCIRPASVDSDVPLWNEAAYDAYMALPDSPPNIWDPADPKGAAAHSAELWESLSAGERRHLLAEADRRLGEVRHLDDADTLRRGALVLDRVRRGETIPTVSVDELVGHIRDAMPVQRGETQP